MNQRAEASLTPPLLGFLAALSWCTFCVAWFEDGAPLRPAWLSALPAPLFVLGFLPLFGWLRGRAAPLWGQTAGRGLVVVALLALCFRLPLAVWGAAGYTTPDGALSGIVALHAREGIAHHVFIPSLPYSGSLKSHLAALLSCAVDLPRAFALSSILFYAVFVAGVYRLGLLLDPEAALPAALYVVFAPAFVTHYSLSNDGNYVEVLAFGTWAIVFAARSVGEASARKTLALGSGLFLGLGLWCHLLAVIYLATVGLVFLAAGGKKALPSLLWLAWGVALGYVPGLLWNAQHGWDSFYYLVPGAHTIKSVARGPGLLGRASLMVSDQLPILLGYDAGYDAPVTQWLFVSSLVALGLVLAGAVKVVRQLRSQPAWGVLLLFALVNLTVATVSLPHVSENPRYILFLMTPVPILLAHLLKKGWASALLAVLIVTGAVSSLAQVPEKVREDARWRAFVSDLERERVKACYTDFYLAAKIDFLSGERVICCSKLGPTLTEYFNYRERVEAAPAAALVPVNDTAAEKVARRLDRLGVSYERRDLMKPTFLMLSRKVDPQELFPEKAFPER